MKLNKVSTIIFQVVHGVWTISFVEKGININA